MVLSHKEGLFSKSEDRDVISALIDGSKEADYSLLHDDDASSTQSTVIDDQEDVGNDSPGSSPAIEMSGRVLKRSKTIDPRFL